MCVSKGFSRRLDLHLEREVVVLLVHGLTLRWTEDLRMRGSKGTSNLRRHKRGGVWTVSDNYPVVGITKRKKLRVTGFTSLSWSKWTVL